MKRILVDSDLQVGSLWGLSPNPFLKTMPGQPEEKMSITPNAGQKYLLECWKAKIAALPPRIDACVLNGDMIDGMQWKQRGMEAMSTDIGDQLHNAEKLLMMQKSKVKKWYVIRGSDYHEKIEGVRAPDILAEYLGVGRSYDVLNLNVEGKIINFAHAIGTTAGFYLATPLNQQAMWGSLMGNSGKTPKADLIVRSHVHNYASLEFGKVKAITTPGWQLQTPYAREKNYYRWIPDIGSVILEVDSEGVTVRKLKYDHPIPSPTIKLA